MNRDQTLLWVGGWASNLRCWRSELERLYPEFKHVFLDAMDFLDRPAELRAAIRPRGDNKDQAFVLAWSLGSLLVHALLSSGREPGAYPMVSLCPIFDFCRPGGPGKSLGMEKKLGKMIRRIPDNRKSLLEDFFKTMCYDRYPSPALMGPWISQAMNYPEETLRRGLEVLRDISINPADTDFDSGNTLFWASSNDPVAPMPANLNTAKVAIHVYPGGHLPFLEYPGLLKDILFQWKPSATKTTPGEVAV